MIIIVVGIYILGMLSFNLPDFSPRYFLVWIAVNFNFSPKFRQMNNNKISNLINQTT
jgi:hypothetical protein